MVNHGRSSDTRGTVSMNFASGGAVDATTGHPILLLQTHTTQASGILTAGNWTMTGPQDRYFSVGWNDVSTLSQSIDQADAVAWTGTGTGSFDDYFLNGNDSVDRDCADHRRRWESYSPDGASIDDEQPRTGLPIRYRQPGNLVDLGKR